MVISTEARLSRIKKFQSVFNRLQECYRKQQQAIEWGTLQNGMVMSSELLWDKYVQNVKAVRHYFMQEENNLIDRHKIIALTHHTILEVQPLNVVGNSVVENEKYLLNVRFAFLFGLHFIVRWNEVYYPSPFYPAKFLYPFMHTAEGECFIQEHYKLLMLHTKQPVPLFWSSQLWFLLEQWGLTHMEYAAKFSPQPS